MLKIVVRTVCVVLMLLVWPFCLFRRTQSVEAASGIVYAKLDIPVTVQQPFEQTFFPVTSKLERMSFVVGFDAQPVGDTFLFELLDGNGKVIVSEEIAGEELVSGSYYDVEVDKWLNRKNVYTFRIGAMEGNTGEIYGMFTDTEGTHTQGNVECSIGGNLVNGQAVTRYYYAFPLNIKNVVCIWAFLATVGISLCGVPSSLLFRKRGNGHI